MDRQNRNTKKAVNALIVVGSILLIALIGTLIYFYAIKDQDQEDELSKITCGCYIIDPAVVNDCGDPKRTFLFNLNTISSDQVCTAKCDINDVADNLLNSSTPKEQYKVCSVKNISDTRCENMIIKDQDGKIITGKIDEGEEINVTATFDKSTYTDYTFKINTESVTPDKVEGNTISKKITDLNGISSVEILATAKDQQGEQINSMVCRRVVDINTDIQAAVTGMVALTELQADGKTKISSINISVTQLQSENVKIRYTFSPQFPTMTALDGITLESEKGSISMSKLDLYDEKNFSNDSFNVLNDHTGQLTIAGEVFVNDISIGAATATVEFADTSGNQEPISDTDKSAFVATKTVTPSCVERTEGNNSAAYTITVKNNKTVADNIASIKDKLPLGFTYTTSSSKVNGSAVSDTSIVTVTPVGDSQEVVWQPATPWSIPAGGTLSISFNAKATANTQLGQNLNEIIVNPVEIPLDATKLRSQVAITVSQDCNNVTEDETPSTGIFDNFGIRILFGVIILFTGWLIYTRPEGNILSEAIASSKIYREIEYNSYKVTNPRKYFEEKTLRKKSRERR